MTSRTADHSDHTPGCTCEGRCDGRCRCTEHIEDVMADPQPAPEPPERRGSRPQNRKTRLDPGRESAIEKRAAQIPRKYRSAYVRAASGEASPRAVIKAFCLECLGWQPDEVRHCTAPACPLFAHRPFQD